MDKANFKKIPKYYDLVPSFNMYRFISKNKANKINILDIGCSKGYGTYILAEVLPNALVTGFDIDNASINFAKKNFKRKNLSFKVINILTKKLHKKYDVITCLEVLEHLNPKLSEQFLKAINKLLSPKGILYLSTPNKGLYDIYSYTKNHINEISKDKLTKLLSKYFLIRNIYGTGLNNKKMHKSLKNKSLNIRIGDNKRTLNLVQKIIKKGIMICYEPRLFYERIVRLFSKIKSYYILKRIMRINKNPDNSTILLFELVKK